MLQQMQGGTVKFTVGGKLFEESVQFLQAHEGLASKLLLMDSFRVKGSDRPVLLNRPLRGFEALIDYLKTDGKFLPSEQDAKKLLDIELEHFGIKKPHL